MKNTITLLFILFACSGNSQIAFEDVQIIDRSFNLSEPYFVKNKNGYELFNVGKNTIYIDSYGDDLSSVTKLTIDLPEEIGNNDITYMNNDKLHLLKFTKNCEIIIYSVDIEQRSYEKISKIRIGKCDELGITSKNTKWYYSINSDGSILLTASSGTFDANNNRKWVISVLAINKDLSAIKWMHSIPEPSLNESNAIAIFSGFDNLGNDKFILYYEGKGSTLNNRSNYTSYIQCTADKVDNIWTYSQSQVVSEKNIEGKLLPFLNDQGEFRYYLPVLKSEDSENITIYLRDQNNNDIKKFETNLVLPKLTAKYYIDFNTVMYPDNEDHTKCRLLLTIEDGRKLKGKHPKYLVNLFLDGDALTEQHLINGESVPLLRMSPDSIVNDKILFWDELMMLEGDQVYFMDKKDVFKKVSSSGMTSHFIIENDVFTIHSEYSAVNLKSQLVKWKF